MNLSNAARSGYALDLAARMTNAGYKPPAAVTAARDAYLRVTAVTAERRELAATLSEATDAIVTAAEAGDLDATDLAGETSRISEALISAATYPDAMRVLGAATDVLGYKLAGAVGGWLPDLLTGPMRQQFNTAATTIDRHASRIPLSLTDSQALRADKALRAAWLQSVDAADTIIWCAREIGQWRQMTLYPHSRRDPIGAFQIVANAASLDDPRLLTSSGWGTIRSTLPEHPVHRLLEMSRRGAQWRLPTTDEQDADAAAYLDADDADKRRMSGRAA